MGLESRIKEIRERLEKATSGPWTRSLVHHYDQTLTYIENENTEAIVIETASGINPGNTKFICNAPEDIRFLLAALDVRDNLKLIQEPCAHGTNRQFYALFEALILPDDLVLGMTFTVTSVNRQTGRVTFSQDLECEK